MKKYFENQEEFDKDKAKNDKMKKFFRQSKQYFDNRPFSFVGSNTFCQTEVIAPEEPTLQEKIRQNEQLQANYQTKMRKLKSFQTKIRSMISPQAKNFVNSNKNQILKSLVKNIHLQKKEYISPFAAKSTFSESSFYNKLEGRLKNRKIVYNQIDKKKVYMEKAQKKMKKLKKVSRIPVKLKKKIYYRNPLEKQKQIMKEFKNRSLIAK